MHSTLNRDQAGAIPASPTSFSAGLADAAMHSPFKRDEAGSIPASRTRFYGGDSSNRIRIMPSKHGTPVQIRHPLPDAALSFNGPRIPGYEPGDWGSNPHGAAMFGMLELTA